MPEQNVTFSKNEYYTIIWALSGVSLAFLAARIVIRLKVYGRLMLDDGLVILAVICLLASDITNSIMAPTTFIVQDVKIHHARKPPHYEDIANTYAKYQWADAYLFFTGIWAVKGAFLAFYDPLTQRLSNYRRAWWVAIGITIATYIGSLFAYAFLDGMHFSKTLQNEAVKYQFSADLTTDVFITAIPLTLALKSQIPRRQKFALAGVFSLTLIITIFSIIRFVMVSPNRAIAGPSWLQAWSAIEQNVSIIIVCCASFRILAVNKGRASKGSSSSRRYNVMNSFLTRKNRAASDDSGFPHLSSYQERAGSSDVESRESVDLESIEPAHQKEVAKGLTAFQSE